MIRNKQDYQEYLFADKKALNKTQCHFYEVFTDPIYKYERLLRKCEYWNNVHTSAIGRIITKILLLRLKSLGYKLGFTIPMNVFGKGLSIAHVGTIVVSDRAKIGDWCRIHTSTNIGISYSAKAPIIGDNVYIGPGAKIFGSITIASGIAVGANAVVNKSFIEEGVTLGGGTC